MTRKENDEQCSEKLKARFPGRFYIPGAKILNNNHVYKGTGKNRKKHVNYRHGTITPSILSLTRHRSYHPP